MSPPQPSKKKASASIAPGAGASRSAFPGPIGQDPRRPEQLYEITKLLASFEGVEQTLDPVLGIVASTLPLRSAILIDAEEGHSTMTVWHAEGQTAEQMRAAKEHVSAAFAYLAGAGSSGATDLEERPGKTGLPRQARTHTDAARRFMVIPLVVAHRPPFGALQLEGARPLDEADLMFVNAIVNQLAIALERAHGWRRDIVRREHAEEERTHAEATGATAERRRVIAESSSEKYEALAAEHVRLYEKAQQAVRVREQVLAVVSHDLRNPLGTILLTAASLARSGAPAEDVARIRRGVERMLRLIEDLLDFASIEAGTLAIHRAPHDPGSMVLEMRANFELVAQEKGLELTAHVEPDLPSADCDRDRILQALSNLIGNATRVTARGGHITLRVEARAKELLFAVADSGPGIREEDAKHLFERYWRSTDAQYKGTGLGLAIVSGIVSAHGGRIWVESELGRGATFLFTVPASQV